MLAEPFFLFILYIYQLEDYGSLARHSKSSTKNLLGFNLMEVQGLCQKCQAPIFMNQSTDWYGNSVFTLNCWNGHYKWISIKDVEEAIKVDPENKLVTHIGFFNVT